ncbi:MAG: flagellar hook protein, partial [Blautia sp.]|nr:flagellar hook protein [Blautia sp.]
SEVDALINEIDRVSETTKFNEIYLLKGDGTEKKKEVVTIPGQDAVEMTAEYKIDVSGTIGVKTGQTAPAAWYEKGSTTAITAADVVNYLELDDTGKVVIKEGKELYKAAAVTGTDYGAQLKAQLVDNAAVQAIYEKQSAALKKNSATGDDATEEDLKDFFNEDGTYKGGLFAKRKTDGVYTEIGGEQIGDFVKVTAGKAKVDPDQKEVEKVVDKALSFNLHVGAEGNDANKITVTIKAMSAKGIGVDGLKTSGVKTEEAATSAIETIKGAIKTVSQQRSDLGAVQNRLEHTINNLDNIVENTQSAESAIRDTDMATEMVKYANNNILAQAGQAMLAQANQANQGVLSLLG